MEVSHQRTIVDALEAGNEALALRLVQDRYDLYIRDRAHLGRDGGA